MSLPFAHNALPPAAGKTSGVLQQCTVVCRYKAYLPPCESKSSFLRSDALGSHVGAPIFSVPLAKRSRCQFRVIMSTSKGAKGPPWARGLEAKQGLILKRQDLDTSSKKGRPARLARWSTLGAIDAADQGPEENRVDVWVLAQRVNADYRLIGNVRTSVQRCCDRCLRNYPYRVRGMFEVWLTTSSTGEVDAASNVEQNALEAVEDFSGVDATVDLVPHVRDSVILSLPTKSLCSADCEGIVLDSNSSVSVTYGVETGKPLDEKEPSANEGKSSAAKPTELSELKKYLERLM